MAENTAKGKIEEWRRTHPNGTQRECIADGVASAATVYRHWPSNDPKKSRKGTAKQRREGTVKTQERSERMTFLLTEERQRQARVICANRGVTLSDLMDEIIADEWEKEMKSLRG